MNRNKNILLIALNQQVFHSLNEYSNQITMNLVWEEKIYGGLERLKESTYDLVVVDMDNQDYSLKNFFIELRNINLYIPVFVLGHSGEESFIIQTLQSGADDYFSKPISYPVFWAKVDSLFRRLRKYKNSSEKLSFGPYSLDVSNFILVTPEGKKILTPSETNILKNLVLNRGEVCSRDDLIGVVRSYGGDIVLRNIDVHITAIRKKMGQGNYWITTVRGVGYLFRASD